MLGYRNDIAILYSIADVCCFPSIREGLGIVAFKGMASGLQLIASFNRETRDYADNGVNALLCDYHLPNEFANPIYYLKNYNAAKMMGVMNVEIAKRFDVVTINQKLKQIYKKL